MSELENVFETVSGRRCLVVLENPSNALEVLVEFVGERRFLVDGQCDDESHRLVLKSELKAIEVPS